MHPAEEVTLGEIGRRLLDLQADVRQLRGEYVRGDVYAAQRDRDDMRLRTLESAMTAMQEARAATQRLVVGAMVTAGLSVVVQLIVATINVRGGKP